MNTTPHNIRQIFPGQTTERDLGKVFVWSDDEVIAKETQKKAEETFGEALPQTELTENGWVTTMEDVDACEYCGESSAPLSQVLLGHHYCDETCEDRYFTEQQEASQAERE